MTLYLEVYVYVKYALEAIFWHAVLWRPIFFITLSAAGKARGSPVRYDACLDPARAPW